MDWVNIIVSILSGLVVAVPLVVELVKWIKTAIQEKNWQELLRLVTNLMEEAETKFDNGIDREEWCLMMVKASADTINYKVDLEQVRKLIQSLCAMSKIVNAPKEETEEVKA